MANFGENLRRERELRHVTLGEISAATKISVRFLSAIEKQQFDKLPGGIFNRGFVRAFASYLGLDEERMVAEYALAAGEVEVPAPRVVPRSTVGANYTRPVLIALVILAVAAGAVYALYEQRVSQPPAEPAAVTSSPAPSSVAAAPATTPAAAEPTPPAPQASTSEAGAASQSGSAPGSAETTAPQEATPATPASEEGTARLRLQIDVMEPSWVSVTVDGRRLFARTLQSRQTQTVTASRIIRLTTGNASAVVLTLNGETLAPLGKPGEIRTVTLTEKDLKTPSP